MCKEWHKYIPVDSHSNASVLSTILKDSKPCFHKKLIRSFNWSFRSLIFKIYLCLIDSVFFFREARPYTVNGAKRIGHKYKKAMFQEFTDATFTTKKERKSDYEKHLGIMGPIIKAEVGDTVEVLFNNMANREYSVHSDGLFYK